MILIVAGDVEPGAGVDKGGVPALKNVGGIGEMGSKRVEGFPFGIGGGGRRCYGGDEEEQGKEETKQSHKRPRERQRLVIEVRGR